ncbi:MAG: Gfo/Idh/MocA family oxidoreductase [Caldilineaceae bacterium]|nr:Gfo/Idh/MocA family oxidoreductase [Caldilineaceae bacterium]
MTQPVRVALMGLGQRGLQHLKSLWALQAQGAVRLSALADAFTANLAADKIRNYVDGYRPEGILHTTRFEELLSQELDVLYVCIPPNVHSGEVVRAAQSGLHLFVEKPMSLYLDEALEMEAAIDEAGVLSTAGFQQRFDGRHEAVHSHLRQGRRPLMASYTYHGPLEGHNVKHHKTELHGGPGNRVWTANRAWSGMTVVEGGIHLLDLWRYWFGDVEWVQAHYQHRPDDEVIDGADNPYTYSALFGFAGGAVGTMTLSRLRKVYADFMDHQVLWTEGRAEICWEGVTMYEYDGPYPPSQPPPQGAVTKTLYEGRGGDDTFAISIVFMRAIAENRPELIRSPFGDAMNSLAAVIGANVSDELGGERVYVDQLLNADRFAAFRQKPD